VFDRAAQTLEVEHRQAAVLELDEAGVLELLQRPVAARPRDAGQVGDLLLRHREVPVPARIQPRMEQPGQRAPDLAVRVEHPLLAPPFHEPVHPLVELVDEEVVESGLAAVEPLEGVARHHRDDARLQRDDVGRPGRGAQQRAFAEPAARRQAAEDDLVAVGRGLRPLQQAGEDAVPVRRELAAARQRLALGDVPQAHFRPHAGARRRRQLGEPGRAGEQLVERPEAVGGIGGGGGAARHGASVETRGQFVFQATVRRARRPKNPFQPPLAAPRGALRDARKRTSS
jgi:hypothetical protein